MANIPAPLIGLMLLIGACGSSEGSGSAEGRARTSDSAMAGAAEPSEPRVSSVMIGKRVGSRNLITEPTFQFAPQDTVYLSVGTEGSGGADTLTVAWRFQSGEILRRSSEPVRPGGENAAFLLTEPKGLKQGTYKVIVFLGRDSVDTKVFVVKK